jgi:molybdopterin converting factor small subunit
MPEVRLLGTALRRAIGARVIAMPQRTLRELLAALSQRGDPDLTNRLYADPEAPEPRPDPDLRLLVNGRNALFLDGLDTQLCETDIVTVHFAGARSFPGG